MKVLMLQTDIVWESPEENRAHAADMIYAAEDADLIVLPEMFTTGFTMYPLMVAEQDGFRTLEWMMTVARERGAAVTGSIVVGEGTKFFNRMFFVRPDGSYDTYDKRHLFTYAGEHEHYSPGGSRVVAEYKGVRILLQICYDLRFPVFSRNRGDYDMIVYVASWPQSRIHVWDTLLRARAIENACYVVGVNRVGRDPEAVYSGSSALIDFKGQSVLEAGDGEKAITGSVDMDMLAAFREKFPVLEDADDFQLK